MIATEKKLPSILVDEEAVQKVHMVSKSIGVVYSGMGPDYRVLVRRARKVAQTYFLKYKVGVACIALHCVVAAVWWWRLRSLTMIHFFAQECIPVLQLVRGVASVMQEFTQRGGVRPFGVSLLICGCDDDGPQLYQVDPSGSYFGWRASAMGKNFINAKTFLEKVRSGQACVWERSVSVCV